VRDFAVERFDLDGSAELRLKSDGPSIVICTSGTILDLAPTEAAYARPGTTTLTGSGTVWRVTTG
jgi:mannose-6-phosphate isomerase class I